MTDSRSSYPAIVDGLERAVGAQVVELDPRGGDGATVGVESKRRIALRLISPSLLRLRGCWGSHDAALIISWYLLPVLFLIRVGLLHRPRKLLALGVFVQSPSIRRAVNAILRRTMIPELEVIAFSEGERRVLIEAVGIPPARIHKLVWGAEARDALQTEGHNASGTDRPYVFSGGYANRDYATLFAAVEGLAHPVVVVASSRNRLQDAPANVDLRMDLPEEEFDRLLRGSNLLVIPLRATGEASGQSVLLRGIQHGRPFVGTRHDALVDYLGEAYAGFVPPEDPAALRRTISRAMTDDSFRRTLTEEVSIRHEFLSQQRGCVSEVLAILEQE